MPEPIKAILIDLIHPRMLARHSAERLVELEQLTNTYGGIVVVKKYQKRFAPHPRTFIGPGKVEELGKEGKGERAKLLIVNNVLKPGQSYTIGGMLKPYGMEVWDRIDLILKIFAKHARTTEAKLEIELASIRHMGPRIFGMGMELSRQGGGIGTSGIGETNIERMKRHLREKERVIKERLSTYQRVREGHRKARERRGLRTVAIVGYTNAGKTTLLNTLTGRREYAADELFATLDTRVGRLQIPGRSQPVLISDTIGFIKQLPPELLNAFSSTLSEAMDADALLHVVDAGDPHAAQHVAVVEQILERLGAGRKPRLLVLNKAETVSKRSRSAVEKQVAENRPCVWVSARTSDGLEGLLSAVDLLLSGPTP